MFCNLAQWSIIGTLKEHFSEIFMKFLKAVWAKFWAYFDSGLNIYLAQTLVIIASYLSPLFSEKCLQNNSTPFQ